MVSCFRCGCLLTDEEIRLLVIDDNILCSDCLNQMNDICDDI